MAEKAEIANRGGGSLGIYGKSSPAFQTARHDKYSLQKSARLIRRGFPVAKCLRWAIPKQHVSILHAKEYGKAFYAGLETCGSVWECPVCAAKISERRRAEVLAAMTAHKAAGGDVLLLTLTNPHYRGDNLPQLLQGQAQAMRRFWGTRAAARLSESLGLVGSIRALEVTDGTKSRVNNGWHPHFHILLFVARGVDLERARREFFAIWSNACRLAGLPLPSFERGVMLDNGNKAQRYISKWGLESEMTKGHLKKGKDQGRTPFDLLRDYREGDKQAGALFVEYANAFKGKRQLYWSSGLKDRFSIEDVTDKDLADREEEEAILGHELSREDWKTVLIFDVRAEILQAFEDGGAFQVAECLSILRGEAEPDPKDQTELSFEGVADYMNWTLERFEEFKAWIASGSPDLVTVT